MKHWLSKLRPEFFALGGLVAFEAYLVSHSTGFYYIDEGAHFMDDFCALRDPSISIGVWQRFGSVWTFMLPAQFGHAGVMIFAVLIFLLTLLVTYKVGGLEGLPHKEWIVVLVGFQPVLLDISFTCLAELPATFFLILAYLLYRQERWKLSLCAASAVFLFRYEMSILAVILFFLAYSKRKYTAMPFALAGPALWYLSSLLWTGDPGWLVREFVKFGSLPKFIPGSSVFHYITHAPDIFGWAPVLLAAVSIVFAVVRKSVALWVPLLVIVWCVLFNTVASAQVFHWSPSVGDFRYLATVGPFVGLFSLDGLGRLMDALRKFPTARFVPPLIALLMTFSAMVSVRPHPLSPFEEAVMAVTERAAQDSTDVPILSNHWASRYAVMHSQRQLDRMKVLSGENYYKFPREYIVWDSEIANSIFSQQSLSLKAVQADPRVRELEMIDLGYEWVRLFERVSMPPDSAAR